MIGRLRPAPRLPQPPTPTPSAPSDRKPNILIIWGDDIGWPTSAPTIGLMGYQTPNIDRIAHEGMMFLDYYAEQSCTAGRSSFITGQAPFATGLSKVGIPGATSALQAEDMIAESLKAARLRHRPVRQEPSRRPQRILPTVHGFDEFFGNLYHLNAEEEPENPTIPRTPISGELWTARRAEMQGDRSDDPTVDPRFGRVGRQVIEDTGPLTKKRMETIDDEHRPPQSTSSTARARPTSRSSAGSTRPECMSAPM